MNIDKDQILALLHSQGDHDKADQAAGQLPDKVDTDDAAHQDLLGKLGVNPTELLSKLGGGSGDGGGLGGALGKLL